MELVLYQGSGEWSALYVDGELNIVGDHYRVRERVFELTDVTVNTSDDFMRGQSSVTGVASKLIDINNYVVEVRTRAHRAADLRSRAAYMLAQAQDLDGGVFSCTQCGRIVNPDEIIKHRDSGSREETEDAAHSR